jgi:hypothetical protein
MQTVRQDLVPSQAGNTEDLPDLQEHSLEHAKASQAPLRLRRLQHDAGAGEDGVVTNLLEDDVILVAIRQAFVEWGQQFESARLKSLDERMTRMGAELRALRRATDTNGDRQ